MRGRWGRAGGRIALVARSGQDRATLVFAACNGNSRAEIRGANSSGTFGNAIPPPPSSPLNACVTREGYTYMGEGASVEPYNFGGNCGRTVRQTLTSYATRRSLQQREIGLYWLHVLVNNSPVRCGVLSFDNLALVHSPSHIS